MPAPLKYSICYSNVTLNFDLSIYKSEVFISVPNYISAVNSKNVTPSEGDLGDWGGYELEIFDLYSP